MAKSKNHTNHNQCKSYGHQLGVEVGGWRCMGEQVGSKMRPDGRKWAIKK